MSIQEIDVILDKLIEAQVLNVIISGGEPFLNYEILLHAVKRLTQADIMSTCNSNMTLASLEQLVALKDAGLPHILTSLSSHNEETNDLVFGRRGAFRDAVKNIRIAADLGIRISVNNIVNIYNYKHVYETGLFAHELGASNYFVTRGGANRVENPGAAEVVILRPEQYIEVLDAAVRLRNETGINIYSLYQYPLCMIKDLGKYREFVGRGCPAGKKLICINVDGNIHACNHEQEPYGNIFEDDVKSAWDKMGKWRNKSLIPKECRDCRWYEYCEGGCRMSADKIDQSDYLCAGPEVIDGLPDPVPISDLYRSMIKPHSRFHLKQHLRFRQEVGFSIVHILGGFVMIVESNVAEFLQSINKSGIAFSADHFPGEKDVLSILLAKAVIELCGQEQA
jgi:radical SAM protein with 4Fe4S-binding SPASM domain